MNNLDILLPHLRAGKFILLSDAGSSWLLGSTRHAAAFEKAVAEAKLSLKESYILADEVGRLHEYVQKFSDLAWDIADGSNKALLIWYEFGKNVPQALLDSEGYIPVMMNRCESLQPLLNKLGHGLLCLPLPSADQTLHALKDVLPLQPETRCKLSPERIMRLSENGQIKFLKF